MLSYMQSLILTISRHGEQEMLVCPGPLVPIRTVESRCRASLEPAALVVLPPVFTRKGRALYIISLQLLLFPSEGRFIILQETDRDMTGLL